MPKQFLRRDSSRFSKLGKNRKKLQKWRRPKGRDNQMRLQRAGYPKTVSIGYKKSSKDLSLPSKLIHNLTGLENLKKGAQIIIAKIGAKKKLEVIKKAESLGLLVKNLGGKK
jgi:large subunit ribosomal protein L32e